MLARAYWETCGRSGVVESDFLDELESMRRDRAAAVRNGASQREEVPLSFPALSHPLFADEVSA